MRTAALLFALPLCALAGDPAAADIVRRSVAATEANWKAAPSYSIFERDVVKKGSGADESKSYQVLLIEGSTYSKLTGRHGRPLPKREQEQEEAKLRAEMQKRAQESPAARQRRIAKYQKEREQNHALLKEMGRAFDYKVSGVETIRGRKCWVLDATPKAGYQPVNTQARVLTGMRGRLWVDQAEYQWVRLKVEVVEPVSFGYVLAKVNPGTQFELEQSRVDGDVWLPARFAMRLNLRKLFMDGASTREETYRNYRHKDGSAMLLAAGGR